MIVIYGIQIETGFIKYAKLVIAWVEFEFEF
jgi:hypothetical protein